MPDHDNLPTFRWNATDYNRSSSAQQQWASELIKKLALNGTERVLDIGCGDGKITAELSQRLHNGSVVGIDSSLEMIGFAKMHFPRQHYPNLSFEEMDARNLTFDEEFDIVFSNAALHWVTDHQPVLAGIQRCLCLGGKMLIQMGGKGNAEQAFRAFDALVRELQWSRYFADFTFPYGFFGNEEYRSWVASAGLDPVRSELIPKIMVHPSRDDFAAWIRTTWLPYLERVPETRQQNFIDELIDRYLLMYPADTHGGIHVGMVRLEVEARKFPCRSNL
ncbi:MAG: methyltransferase domain-containing protein [Methanoregula sp.]|jgi:trans-aconitate methyltransferase